jgi:hypothetical protein
VLLVESLSVVLDQLSDMLDRVHAEAFLESARQPESLRRLLAMIGFDALNEAGGEAGSEANIPQASAIVGESEEDMRLRLGAFHNALLIMLDDYQSSVDELSPGQQLLLQEYIAAPDTAVLTALNTLQLFLDNSPEFVTRAQQLALHRYWSLYPRAMELARSAGPKAIHRQKRMVTEQDYAERMQDHPLVLLAHAYSAWTGSWSTLYVAVVMQSNITLDTRLNAVSIGGAETLSNLQNQVDAFHRKTELERVNWALEPSPRNILRPYLEAYRMACQEVFLHDAQWVGINISLSLRVAANYFQSEVRRAVLDALGSGLGGFFEPGRLLFGEDLHSSDIIETLMALDGIEAVCLNRFKRVGKRYPDQADAGRIILQGLEIGVCNNDPSAPELGILRLVTHGGHRG